MLTLLCCSHFCPLAASLVFLRSGQFLINLIGSSSRTAPCALALGGCLTYDTQSGAFKKPSPTCLALPLIIVVISLKMLLLASCGILGYLRRAVLLSYTLVPSNPFSDGQGWELRGGLEGERVVDAPGGRWVWWGSFSLHTPAILSLPLPPAQQCPHPVPIPSPSRPHPVPPRLCSCLALAGSVFPVCTHFPPISLSCCLSEPALSLSLLHSLSVPINGINSSKGWASLPLAVLPSSRSTQPRVSLLENHTWASPMRF